MHIPRVKNNFSGQLAKWPTTLKFGWPYGKFGWPSCSRAHVAHSNAMMNIMKNWAIIMESQYVMH